MNDGELITTETDIANTFNNYFTSVASNILNERKYEGNKSYKDYLKNPLPNSFVMFPCNEDEIILLINQFKQNKSTGPNSIPSNILQLLAQDISKPLSMIFNLSFETGMYPDKLKISKVTPIFKKGSRLVASNYRPISLLSNINKLLEKLMHSRLTKYLEDYECFYDLQFGFRNKHSTNHALIKITESIRTALDKNKIAYGVFIDLQKAFDTVNHKILLGKLEHYGIRATANSWFESYLTGRSQFVSINGFNSNFKNIYHGVPQGSVLGPLLFLIYINDLHNAIRHSDVYHFADDTNLLHINTNLKKARTSLNIDLKSLHRWLLANKISLNESKTELIFFHKPSVSRPSNTKIKLNGTILEYNSSIKYLGVYLDETLTGNKHCSELAKKLNRANGMMAKVRHYAPNEILSIYHSIFSSHLIYGIQIWGQAQNTLFDKIMLLQKTAVRIMSFSNNREHTSPLFKQFKILKLKDQVTLENILFVHKFLKNDLPLSFNNYFTPTSQLYCNVTTRGSVNGCLYVPAYNTSKYGLHSITRESITAWNNIVKKFKNENLLTLSNKALKKKISNLFLESY